MSCPEISTYRNLKKSYPLNLMRCSDTYIYERSRPRGVLLDYMNDETYCGYFSIREEFPQWLSQTASSKRFPRMEQ